MDQAPKEMAIWHMDSLFFKASRQMRGSEGRGGDLVTLQGKAGLSKYGPVAIPTSEASPGVGTDPATKPAPGAGSPAAAASPRRRDGCHEAAAAAALASAAAGRAHPREAGSGLRQAPAPPSHGPRQQPPCPGESETRRSGAGACAEVGNPFPRPDGPPLTPVTSLNRAPHSISAWAADRRPPFSSPPPRPPAPRTGLHCGSAPPPSPPVSFNPLGGLRSL